MDCKINSNSDMSTELYNAYDSGNMARVLRLISDHPHTIVDNSEKISRMLFIATIRGHITMVRLLLNAGIDVARCTMEDRDPLFAACLHGYVSIVEEFLSRGSDPNRRSCHGNTLLCLAAKMNNSEMIDVLLRFGSNPTIPDGNGYTPKMIAAKCSNIEIMKKLLLAERAHH